LLAPSSTECTVLRSPKLRQRDFRATGLLGLANLVSVRRLTLGRAPTVDSSDIAGLHAF
jgi:hypothetical protein